MKKLALLTSILALAACGGGSGGGSGGAVVPGGNMPGVNPDANQITSMVPEITVDGPDGQKTATLEDVKFFDPALDSGNMYVSFGVDDNGEIDSIKLYDNGATQEIARGENNMFTQSSVKYKVSGIPGGQDYYTTDMLIPKDYSNEEIIAAFEQALADQVEPEILAAIKDKVNSGQVTREELNNNIRIDLYGKNAGLQYSDFGVNTIMVGSGPDAVNDSSVMFGGYDIKKIENPVFADDVTFTGKAIATLARQGDDADKIIATNDNATTLNFKDGNATLTMPFNGWYSIIVENANGGNYSLRYDGESTIGYELNGIDDAKFNINYYGDNDDPTEAVGGVSFDNNGVEFNGAFGVTRK